MVRIPIKPGNQTDETEIPNLINKIGLEKVSNFFFISIKLFFD